jgi:hypothetical protein
MRCPVASCMRDVQPKGFCTGLQELLAIRIHLARDHGIFKDTKDVLELRVDEESIELPSREIVYINVEKNERYLNPPPWRPKLR